MSWMWPGAWGVFRNSAKSSEESRVYIVVQLNLSIYLQYPQELKNTQEYVDRPDMIPNLVSEIFRPKAQVKVVQSR